MRRKRALVAAAVMAALASAANGLRGEDAVAPSPYAGDEGHAVKSLSQAEIADLLAGRGMGLAKAAELNHYPGPAHVLAMADQLRLSAEQRVETETLFASMEAEAARLGRATREKEKALEALFADGKAVPGEVRALTAEIAALGGELRYAHLAAHLAMRRILSDEQVALYDRLRGYGTGAGAPAGQDGAQRLHQHHDP